MNLMYAFIWDKKKTIVNLFYFFLLYVGGGKGELGCRKGRH